MVCTVEGGEDGRCPQCIIFLLILPQHEAYVTVFPEDITLPQLQHYLNSDVPCDLLMEVGTTKEPVIIENSSDIA